MTFYVTVTNCNMLTPFQQHPTWRRLCAKSESWREIPTIAMPWMIGSMGLNRIRVETFSKASLLYRPNEGRLKVWGRTRSVDSRGSVLTSCSANSKSNRSWVLRSDETLMIWRILALFVSLLLSMSVPYREKRLSSMSRSNTT